MTDTPRMPATALHGDAVSQMLQVIANNVGLQNAKWTGKCEEDLRSLVCRVHNTEMLNHELWEMARTVLNLADTEGVPESFKAAASIAILKVKAIMMVGGKR